MPKIHYVIADEAGILRRRVGKDFEYHTVSGKAVTNIKILDRIKTLAIPPAYENVWICKYAYGHIQAYGYDAQKRKQYIYHHHWTALQNKKKFDHLLKFGLNLSKLRGQLLRDIKLPGLPKKKVLAGIIRLIDTTCIRIGSPQYDSYGLLTLKKKHISMKNNVIHLDFLGKSKKQWHLEITDNKLKTILDLCLAIKGNKIFKYYDDENHVRTINASDVNEYLKEITQCDTSAKEFRTWRASAYFISQTFKADGKPTPAKLRILIDKVAKYIWNTPTVCKNSYIHPLVMKLYLRNALQKDKQFTRKRHLTLEENYLIYLLEYY